MALNLTNSVEVESTALQDLFTNRKHYIVVREKANMTLKIGGWLLINGDTRMNPQCDFNLERTFQITSIDNDPRYVREGYVIISVYKLFKHKGNK